MNFLAESASSIVPVNDLSLFAFDLELILTTALFAFKLPKRKYFLCRLLACLAIMIGYTLLWRLNPDLAYVSIICYTIFFALLILALAFCFQISPLTAVFLATAGYASQHFNYKLIQIILGIGEFFAPSLQTNNIGIIFIYAGIYILFNIFIYFIFARRIQSEDSPLLENARNIILGAVILIGATSLNLLFESFFNPLSGSSVDLGIFLVGSIYDMISCFLTLTLLFQLFNNKKLTYEYKQSQKIWEQEKKQLKISKENLDYLLILAHDLKHEVEDIGDNNKTERIRKLNDKLADFANSLKTGNETLDLVLAERKSKMDKHEITLAVVADGKALDFLRPDEIYSMFMNILDNAIEALLKIKEKSSRTLSLNIKKEMGLVFIHEENPYVGTISTKDGLPVTSKTDKLFHGLGTMSIKRVTDNYKGQLKFDFSDNTFKLDIVLDPSSKREEI